LRIGKKNCMKCASHVSIPGIKKFSTGSKQSLTTTSKKPGYQRPLPTALRAKGEGNVHATQRNAWSDIFRRRTLSNAQDVFLGNGSGVGWTLQTDPRWLQPPALSSW